MTSYVILGLVVAACCGCVARVAAQEVTPFCNSGWVLCPESENHCVPKKCQWETSPSPRCKPGESFCVAEEACFKPCGAPGAAGQNVKCPPGKNFCPRTGGCLATRACEGWGGEVCGRGFTFCAERGGCVWGRCPGSAPPVTSCPPGTVLCPSTGSCVGAKQCQSHSHGDLLDAIKCLPGNTLCLATGECVAEGEKCDGGGEGPDAPPLAPTTTCAPYQEFCLPEGGTCVPRGTCGGDRRASHQHDDNINSRQAITCPPQMVFCPTTGSCQPRELCSAGVTTHDPPLLICPPNKVFCPTTGSCQPRELCSAGVTTHDPSPLICPPNKVFCPTTGSCQPRELCSARVTAPDPPPLNCPPNKVFCPTTGSCQPRKLCSTGVTTHDPPALICPPNKVLCLASGTCEEAGGCASRPSMSLGKMCPRGFVYCLERDECVLASVGCSKSTGSVGKSCPPGSVLSLLSGSCMPLPIPSEGEELPSLQCPASNGEEDSQFTFVYTTCLSDKHCPLGYSCCPDKGTLHLQCVNASGNADDSALSMTCSLMDGAEHDTGLKCNSPSDCRPTSVCCNGTCRSKKGVNSCPLTTLYCSVTKKCVKLGEKCGSVCPPGTTLCSTNNSCIAEDDCIRREGKEVAWTMPSIKRASLPGSKTEGDSRGDAVLLSDTFSGAPTVSADSSNVLHEVINMTKWFGNWSYLKYNKWIPMGIGSRLVPVDFIRYELNTSLYAFGLDYITLQEVGRNISRVVVQLVAPESPVVKIVDVVSSINMTEDVAIKIRLSDIVNFTCEDEHYWMAWKNAVARDLVRTASMGGFLDLQSWIVEMWVTLLQHPELPPDREELDEDPGCSWEGPGLDWDDESIGVMGGQHGTGDAVKKNIRMQRGHTGRKDKKHNHGKEKRLQNNEERGTGDSERGLFLQWAQQYSSRSGEMITVKYLNKNNKWRTMNLDNGHNLKVVSCDNAQNTWLELDPALNVYGSFTLNISVYPMGEDAGSTRNREINIFNVILKVEGINDPPEALAVPIHSEIPTIMYGQTISGIPVSQYLKAYYVDPDGEPFKSMLLLYATGGIIGDMQFSLDGGSTYENVVLETNPFPSELQVSTDHQGIVDLNQEMLKQTCITDLIRNSNDLSSVAEENKCLQKSKKQLALKGFKTAIKKVEIEDEGSPGQNRRKRAVGEPPEILRQFEGFSVDLLSSFPVVRSLCIPASTGLLKFSSSLPYWTMMEGIQNTGLVYIASDDSCSDANPRAAVWLNYSLADGFREGVERKHAVNPVRMSIQMSDCTGYPFLSEPRTEDACGVCGGDNACVDCAGIADGNAVTSCEGECVGGTTGKPLVSGCISSGVNGSTNSSQLLCQEPLIFSCGVCANSSRKDKCGICFGYNDCVGCDGEVESGAKEDACGECLMPDDPNFNDCLVLQYTGDTLDAAVNSVVGSGSEAPGRLGRFSLVEANVIGLESKKYEAENCSLENKDGQISEATRIRYKRKTMKVAASFKTLLSGEVTFKCSFKLKRKKGKKGKGKTEEGDNNVELETRTPLVVVDSRALALESNVDEVDTTQNMIVILTLEDTVPLDQATCFLVYPEESANSGKAVKGGKRKNSRKVKLLDSKVDGEKSVSCLVPKNTRPGQAQIGLQVTKAAKVLMQRGLLSLPTLPLTLKAGAPQVVSAILKKNGIKLVLSFNMNVNSETECSKIIDWPWKDTNRSPPPVCTYMASKLTVELGPNIEIKPNTSLTFTDGNGIRRHSGDSTTAPEVTGSTPLIQQQSQMGITFRLIGISKACSTSYIKAVVSRIKGIKISNVQPEWNITFVPDVMEQQEVLSVWNSLDKIRNNMVTTTFRRSFILKVPGNLFLPDVKYLVVVYLKGRNGEESEPQSMTVTTLPRNETLQVRINGPTSGLADINYVYSAAVSPCLEPDNQAVKMEFKYIWNLDVPWDPTMIPMEGTFISIPGNKLQGGRTYTLSVVVHAVQDASITGSSQLKIDIASQGIKVVTSAEFLQVSSVSHLILDASKSVDLDNEPGLQEFRWSCLTEDGMRCVLNGNGFLEDEILTTESKLKVRSGSLFTGKYNFTVNVNKGTRSARKDVIVHLIEGICPVINTKPPVTPVDPSQKIIVPATVTGVESTPDFEIQWLSVEESGFLEADISQLISGEINNIKSLSPGAEERFDLVLPAPGVVDSFVPLVGDGMYKFRVQVTTPHGVTCSNDVIINLNSPPKDGSFQVTPTTGEAFVTNFTFNATGWTDADLDTPLSYYFGYDNGETPVGWKGPFIEEEPAFNFTLPIGNEEGKVTAVVKVCDVHESCTVMEGPTLTLSLPSSVPPGLLSSLVDNFKEQISDNSVKMALFTFIDQLKTLMMMGDEDRANALKTVADPLTLHQVSSVTASFNSKASVKKAGDVMDGVVVMISQTGGSKELLDRVPTLTQQYSDVVLDDPISSDRIIFPDDTRRRSKREVHQSTSQEEDAQEMTEEVKRILGSYEAVIKEKETTDDIDTLDMLLKELPKYLSGMSKGMSAQDDTPREVKGNMVTLKVKRSNLIEESDEPFYFAEFKESNDDSDESQVTWGSALSEYEEWYCGMKGDEMEKKLCRGACVTTTMLKEDYFSVIKNIEPPGKLRTYVVKTTLLNPDTYVEIPVKMKKEDRITYELSILGGAIPEGYKFKCYGWSGSEWDGRLCSTGKAGERLHCSCSSPVYVAGFLMKDTIPSRITAGRSEVPSSNNEESTTSPSTGTENPNTGMSVNRIGARRIRFVIEGDFDAIVGQDVDEFKDGVTTKVAAVLNVTKNRIFNLTVTKGSVNVEFEVLEDHTRTSGVTAEQLYDKLQDIINTGGLVILGANSEEIKVPPQALDGSGPEPTEKKDPTRLPIIIGSIIGGIVLVVLVFICIAIYLKNKKRMDKVQPLQMSDSKQPTYSSIHFDQAMDGTMTSLVKHRNPANISNRSLSSGGSYADEGIYIERRSTANSSNASSGPNSAGGNRSYDSGTGGDREDVPKPFRYHSPTKEDLERSGPIPEHIIQKMNKDFEALPGTPGSLQ